MLAPFMRRTLLIAAVPLVAALVLIAATTSGETAIRPPVLPALAAVLLVGTLAAAGRLRRLDLPMAALLGIVASALLFFPGLPRGHDVLHHVWGVWAVAREARAGGGLMPLWVHGLGFGMPLLQFYGPAGFAVSLPFSLAGLGPAAALKATFLVFGAVASLGMYLAAARWTGDRRAALVAAAAYAYAPYRLLDVHYRAAFGESAGLAVLPFVLLFGSAAVRAGGWRRLAAASAAAAVLVVSHPISALIAAIGHGLWTVAELALDLGHQAEVVDDHRRDPLRRIGRLAGVWLLGAALAGFFVVPFAANVKQVSLGSLVRGDERSLFAGYGLVPGDMLARREWSGFASAIPVQDPRDGSGQEMPYYFGLVLLALLPLGAGSDRAPKGLPWMTAAALLLSLRPAATAASLLFPPLAALQFPWRFLGLATFGAAALAGLAAARLLEAAEGRRWQIVVPGLLAALLVADAFPCTGAADWYPAHRGLAYLREPQPGCGRRWGCWEAVEIAPPYALRAAGLLLPAEDPEIDVSAFCCAYPDFETPAARALSSPARSRLVLVRAGVGLMVGPIRQRLVRLPAEPYAVLRRGRDRSEARPFTRRAGEIAVLVDGRPGTVTVLEEYFPGWQVLTANGWQEAEPARNGLLRARVERGQTEVRFRYRRWTRPRIAGWLLTGLTALGLLAGVTLGAWRPRPRAAPPPARG